MGAPIEALRAGGGVGPSDAAGVLAVEREVYEVETYHKDRCAA